MKTWPDDPRETASFSDLVDPLRDALRFGYRMIRRRAKLDVPYDGYHANVQEAATYPQGADALSADRLEVAKSNCGTTLLDVVLTLVFQIGMEQGRRSLMRDLVNFGYLSEDRFREWSEINAEAFAKTKWSKGDGK